MPIPSPFHERTQALCTSYRCKDWAGYCAVCSYDTTHEREYFAFRESAGLLDVTPLYKYEVRGPDAAALLSRMMVRDVGKLKVGRVAYSCWCDDDGKVLDDGTVARLDETYYRVTAADPTLHWLQALSPRPRRDARGLERAAGGAGAPGTDLARRPRRRRRRRPGRAQVLRRHPGARSTACRCGSAAPATPATSATRCGCEAERALRVWDALIAAGRPHGIEPAGLDALDVARIEAGFMLLGIDYYSSHKVVLESRKSTPLELGLRLDGRPRARATSSAATRSPPKRRAARPGTGRPGGRAGRSSRRSTRASACRRRCPATARRDGLPVYADDGRQVGKATSHTWSPILKKYLALASVERGFEAPGTPAPARAHRRVRAAQGRRHRRRHAVLRPGAEAQAVSAADRSKYDAIVVGGGHNGLVCAAYLARAGRKVLVLERRHQVGGAAATEEIYPGLQVLVLLLRRQPAAAVDHPRPRAAAPRLRDPAAGVLVHAVSATAATCSATATRSARAARSPPSRPATPRSTSASARRWPSWAGSSSRSSTSRRPTRCRAARASCCASLRLAKHVRGQGDDWLIANLKMMTMSAVDFLAEWFECEQLIAPMSSPASSAPSSACARRAPPTCCSTTTWARSTARSAPGGFPRAAPARSPRRSPPRRGRSASRSAPRRRWRGC